CGRHSPGSTTIDYW
nr:immunoglobulin heavy chain junction region [Macaca mulatta]